MGLNRRVALFKYTVPVDAPGRPEAVDLGDGVRQNLHLVLLDIAGSPSQKLIPVATLCEGDCLFQLDYTDSKSLDDRASDAALNLDGTDSRDARKYRGSVSFFLDRASDVRSYFEALQNAS